MNKIIKSLCFIITIQFYSACSKDKNPEIIKFELNTPDDFKTMDFEIYNFILNSYYSDSSQLIVQQKIDYFLAPIIYKSEYSNGDFYDLITSEHPEIDTIAYLDFLSKNDTVKFLKNDFKINEVEVKLISIEEVNSYFKKGRETWNYFYNSYPKSCGIIELSRIGFNGEENQAVVEVFQSVGWKGSRAYLYFLKRENLKWKVIEMYMTKTNF